ncbi:MAG: hypothetical protein ACOC4Y_01410, partial [bacterium]
MYEHSSPLRESSFAEIMTDLSIYEGIEMDYTYYEKLGVLVLDGWILELDGERYELPLDYTEAEAVASDIIWNNDLEINKAALIYALQ